MRRELAVIIVLRRASFLGRADGRLTQGEIMLGDKPGLDDSSRSEKPQCQRREMFIQRETSVSWGGE